MSGKLNPLIDNLNKTAAQANDTLSHIDAVIGEDRPDLHKAIASLRPVARSGRQHHRPAKQHAERKLGKSR